MRNACIGAMHRRWAGEERGDTAGCGRHVGKDEGVHVLDPSGLNSDAWSGRAAAWHEG